MNTFWNLTNSKVCFKKIRMFNFISIFIIKVLLEFKFIIITLTIRWHFITIIYFWGIIVSPVSFSQIYFFLLTKISRWRANCAFNGYVFRRSDKRVKSIRARKALNKIINIRLFFTSLALSKIKNNRII